MTVRVSVYEARTNLSRLIEQVLAGERVVISRPGKPDVDLVRHQGTPVVFGGLKGEIRYDEAAFDAADAEVAAMFNLEADDPA